MPSPDSDLKSNGKLWAMPDGLSPDGQKAYSAICKFLLDNDAGHSGGCKVFYSPEEWSKRRESYGTKSLLIVAHDGGSHAPAFNLDYEAYEANEQLNQALKKEGLYVEQCTSWYSAVYKI